MTTCDEHNVYITRVNEYMQFMIIAATCEYYHLLAALQDKIKTTDNSSQQHSMSLICLCEMEL